MLRGATIVLRPLDPANSEISRRWVNDPEVNRWMLSGHVPLTEAAETAWYERMESSDSDHVFEIHVADDDRYIGNCGLNLVDMVHRTCELGITIGEIAEQGRGYGRDAIITLMRFGFDTLGMHRIAIRYVEGNERGAHLYRDIGFRECGRERERTFLRGRFHDEILLDMLEGEFRERYGHVE